MTRKERISSIDTIKFIAAIAVIVIHFAPEGLLGRVLQVISRFAVPYFFMVSGFFSANKECEAINRTIKKMVNITLGISIFYFVVAVYHSGFRQIISEFSCDNFLKVILFNAPQIVSAHLWYMYALIYCYVIYKIYLKVSSTKLDVFIGFVLIILHLILVEILPWGGITVFRDNYPLVRNVWLMGFPFFLIGKSIFSYKEKLCGSKVTGVIYICVIVGVLMAGFTGAYNFSYFLPMYVSSVLISIGVFVLAVRYPYFGQNTIFEKLGHNESMWLYLIHPVIGNLVISEITEGELSWSTFFIIVIVTILFAKILSSIGTKIKGVHSIWR